MELEQLLIANNIVLALGAISTVVLLVLWLKAELKVAKLGGKTWVWKEKKNGQKRDD